MENHFLTPDENSFETNVPENNRSNKRGRPGTRAVYFGRE
jgi:hypothetical protein